jgi:transcriptional regulator NrdR family protein
VEPRDTPAANAVPADRGLICRKCGGVSLRVLYTRRYVGGKLVRLRECRDCGARMITSERAVG